MFCCLPRIKEYVQGTLGGRVGHPASGFCSCCDPRVVGLRPESDSVINTESAWDSPNFSLGPPLSKIGQLKKNMHQVLFRFIIFNELCLTFYKSSDCYSFQQ